jgi:DNA-binding LacI/PurR family transcriptional regulator
MAGFLVKGISFDALFAASDLIAIHAMGVMRAQGLRVPQDVCVVGYDDVGMAAHSFPPLTTVSQPMDLAGEALVSSLLTVIRQGHADSRMITTALVERDSTRI